MASERPTTFGSLYHIRALDHQLLLTIGAGLVAVACAAALNDIDIVTAYLLHQKIPPTLSLHLDEGSPAYAMTWFLAGQCDLRMISTHDIYHHKWNEK